MRGRGAQVAAHRNARRVTLQRSQLFDKPTQCAVDVTEFRQRDAILAVAAGGARQHFHCARRASH